MRCPKLLWWTVHEPGAVELRPTEVDQDRFAEGQAVGQAARARFPDLESEVPFEADGVRIRVDLLERTLAGVSITEVKATNEVKDDQIDDLAIQVHVLRAGGTPVASAALVHLNRAARLPDRGSLLTQVDVTAKVERRLPVIAEAIASARSVLEGPLPEVPIGAQCQRGKEDQCPFFARCWKDIPEHHVSTLYHIGKKWVDLAARGYRTIPELPDGVKLPKPETARQVRSVKLGAAIIEPGLAAALAAWPRPIACLDFETVSTPIPEFSIAAPWEQVPAQFSVHHEAAGDHEPRHHEWMADRAEDPRPELARALVAACEGAATIVAWYAGFEKGCLRHLQASVPHLATELAGIEARLVDALPVVRDNFYDPRFGGSFSLKKVQPVLVPDLPGYGSLEVQEGQLASVLLKRLMRGEPAEAAARSKVRRDLLDYCALDTLGLLQLVLKLRQLAG